MESVGHGLWAPGRGPGCYGVWTQTWSDKKGAIPPDLVSILELDPVLLERVRNKTCPYGAVYPGQVTWPHETADSVASFDYFNVVAFLYSYVPYLLGAYVIIDTIIDMIRRRRITTTRLYVLLWLAQAITLQELIFKPIFQQPRPGTMLQVRNNDGKFVGSCVESCGMPSSHSMLAMGWVTILLFDRIYRIHPFTIQDTPTDVSCGSQCRQELRSYCTFFASLSLKPWSDNHLTHMQFMSQIALWAALLAPVPWMRVVLKDHTTEQAIWGSGIGVCDALLWWRLARGLQKKFRHLEDTAFPNSGCCREWIFHDFKLPHVPASVHDATTRAASNLEGQWVRVLPGSPSVDRSELGDSTATADAQFSVQRSQSSTHLRVMRYPGTFSSPDLSIYHVDMDSRTAFLKFQNGEAEFIVNSYGRAEQVSFANGVIWMRPPLGDLSMPLQASMDEGAPSPMASSEQDGSVAGATLPFVSVSFGSEAVAAGAAENDRKSN